ELEPRRREIHRWLLSARPIPSARPTPSAGRNSASDLDLELAERRGHDVDKLVDFLRRDAERRGETQDATPGIHYRAALPGFPVERGDDVLVERSARPVRLDELRAHQEPTTAH